MPNKKPQFTFDLTGHVKAVLPFASEVETRVGLDHIAIDPGDEPGTAVAVATDSYALAAIEIPIDGDVKERVLIPAAFLNLAAKLGRKDVVIEVDSAGDTVRAVGPNGCQISAPLLDAEYPAWRTLVADRGTDPGSHPWLNAELTGRVQRFVKAAGPHEAVQVTGSLLGPYVVRTGNGAIVAIMPVRMADEIRADVAGVEAA